MDMRPVFTEEGFTYVYIKVSLPAAPIPLCARTSARAAQHICPIRATLLLMRSFVDLTASFVRGCTQHNNLYLMTVTKRNSNVALMFMYLYRLVQVCKHPPRFHPPLPGTVPAVTFDQPPAAAAAQCK